MGNGVSVQSHLAGDEVQSLYAALAGTTPISLLNDDEKGDAGGESSSSSSSSNVWGALSDFPEALSAAGNLEIEKSVHEYGKQMSQNHRTSNNLGRLMIYVSRVLEDVNFETREVPTKAINAVVLLSAFLKYFVEETNVEECAWACNYAGENATISAMHQLGTALLSAVCMNNAVQVTDATYPLHHACVSLLLVMSGTQLTQNMIDGKTNRPTTHPFLEKIHEVASTASAAGSPGKNGTTTTTTTSAKTGAYTNEDVVSALLRNFIEQKQPKTWLKSYGVKPGSKTASAEMNSSGGSSSLQAGGASASGKVMLTLSPLADVSSLLLLVLINFNNPTSRSKVPHSFRYALRSIRNIKEENKDIESGVGGIEKEEEEENARIDVAGVLTSGGKLVAKVSFTELYETFGRALTNDISVLLFYSCILGASDFCEYCLNNDNVEVVVMPLLEMLYQASARTQNQIYMILIVLLIMSQGEIFNANVHKIQIPQQISWYKERILTKTTLGSLIIIVLTRTVRFNMAKLRDVYLHTNCFAALANMAPHFRDVSAYAAQRLVSIFELIAKKYLRFAQLHADGMNAKEDGTDMHVYADFLRILLELFNAALSQNVLVHNPELIYALLHREETLKPFEKHARFKELLENINVVLVHFNEEIDRKQRERGLNSFSIPDLTAIITIAAKSYSKPPLHDFHELKFAYEEEERPEDFFTPYVQSLCLEFSGILWNPNAIALLPTT